MKKVLIFALLTLSQVAFADCVTMDSGKTLLKKHLEEKGEVDFPQIFEGKSIPEKQDLVNELVSKTEVVEYEEYNDLKFISGYSILIEKSDDRWGRWVETYLFVSCDGNTEKQEFAND